MCAAAARRIRLAWSRSRGKGQKGLAEVELRSCACGDGNYAALARYSRHAIAPSGGEGVCARGRCRAVRLAIAVAIRATEVVGGIVACRRREGAARSRTPVASRLLCALYALVHWPAPRPSLPVGFRAARMSLSMAIRGRFSSSSLGHVRWPGSIHRPTRSTRGVVDTAAGAVAASLHQAMTRVRRSE